MTGISNHDRADLRLPEHVIPEEHLATVQHLATLVFLSYRFSQGGIGTQNRLLQYLSTAHYPDFMTDERAPLVQAEAHRLIGPYFLNQSLHPATAIPWDDESGRPVEKTEELVVNELAGLFERFKNEKYLDQYPHDPASIAASIITMDADYLRRPKGRAGDSEALKIVVSPYKRDAYASLFINYGILGEPTNSREFDGIFHAISRDEVIRKLDHHTLGLLLDVIDAYTSQHADQTADPRIKLLRSTCEEIINARQ